MQRLTKKNLNTGEEFDRILEVRKQKGVDEFDLRRWKTLLQEFKGGALVDLGCLDSLVPDLAKEMYPDCEVWGIDLSEQSILEMKYKYGPTFLVRDIYATGFKDGQFDYAVLGEVIEHLEDPEKAIAEALRILKPGGWLAISTPLEEAKEHGAVDHIHHLWSFTEDDIKELTRPHEVRTKVLRSIKEPVYKYCWPQLIAFIKKGE